MTWDLVVQGAGVRRVRGFQCSGITI